MTERLNVALAIYRLTPVGGLEDHALRIADELTRRGHAVTFLCAGPAPEARHRVLRLPAAAKYSNHAKMAAFAADAARALASGFDRSVAFQYVPGADFLFLADPVGDPGHLHAWKRLLPRYRVRARLEAACLGPGSRTRIIGVSPAQIAPLVEARGVNPQRIRIAPPTLSHEKCEPALRTPENRRRLRAELGLPEKAEVWLWLGLKPKTKGLDRVLAALAMSANAQLLAGGIDPAGRTARGVMRRAQKLGVAERVRLSGYLPPRQMLEAMAASDVLAHPARLDTTGAVILEAMINGLPVVVTGNCGFSGHVRESGAGLVVDEPFDVELFRATLERVCSGEGEEMSRRGIDYGRRAGLFDGIAEICDWIEAEGW